MGTEPFSAMETDLCPNFDNRSMNASAKQFFNFFLKHFAITYRASVKWNHPLSSFFANQSIVWDQDDRLLSKSFLERH